MDYLANSRTKMLLTSLNRTNWGNLNLFNKVEKLMKVFEALFEKISSSYSINFKSFHSKALAKNSQKTIDFNFELNFS